MILTGQCDSAQKMPNGHILTHAEDAVNNSKLRDEAADTDALLPYHHQHHYNSLPTDSKLVPTSATSEHLQHQPVPPSSVGTATVAAGAASEMGRRRLPSLPSVASTASSAVGGVAVAATSAAGATASVNYSAKMAPSPAGSSGAAVPSRLLYHTNVADALSTNLSSSSSLYTATSFTPSAPGLITYYTSSAPEKCDAAVNGNVPSVLNNAALSDSRVLFDPNAVAYAQAVALGPAPSAWSSSSSAASPLLATTTITTTSMFAPRAFADEFQQQLNWPPKGPVVIPGALYNLPSSSPAATWMPSALAPTAGRNYMPTSTATYLPRSATASPAHSGSLPRRNRQLQQQQQYRSSTLERASQETHAMLNFKQELRHTLEKRRKQLDLCDIEAGHREYVINKWMHSGILPSRQRSSDADAIPPVIKCSLPAELLANVGRIVPLSSSLSHHPIVRYGTASLLRQNRNIAAMTATTELPATASRTSSSSPYGKRTLGCQTGDGTSSSALRATPLKQQQMQQPKTAMLSSALSDASTQTALCAETQTDNGATGGISLPAEFDGTLPAMAYQRQQQQRWHHNQHSAYDGSPPSTTTTAYGRHIPQRDTTYYWPHPQEQEEAERVSASAVGESDAAAAETVALQRQKQQRHRSRLARFLHTDTAEWERRLRERQLQQELNIRREAAQQQQNRMRHADMEQDELFHRYRQPQQQPVGGATAQYAFNQQPWPSWYGYNNSNPQRYWTGSLPRLDHMYSSNNRLFARHGTGDGISEQVPFSSSYWPDPSIAYQQQQQQARYGYCSLPRNYERSWVADQRQQPVAGPAAASAQPSTSFGPPTVDYFGRFSSSMAQQQPPFGGIGTPLQQSNSARYSKSVQDHLNRFGEENSDWSSGWWSPKWAANSGANAVAAPSLSRSMNCLDRLGRAADAYGYDGTNEFWNGGTTSNNGVFNRRRTGAAATNGGGMPMSNIGTMDDMNMMSVQHQQQHYGAATAVAADHHNELLSNYANFLNNQFMMEQQRQREADDREMGMVTMMTAPPSGGGQQGTMATTTAHMEDERRMVEALPPVMLEHPVLLHQRQAEQQQCQMMPPPPLQQQPPTLAPAQAPSQYNYAGPPPQPCVYSRGLDGEHNYGVRPPAGLYRDYGNVHWRNAGSGDSTMFRQQQQQQQPSFYYGQQDWMNNNNGNSNIYGTMGDRMAYSGRATEYQQQQPQILPMSTMASMVQQQPQFYSAPAPLSSRFSWPYEQPQQHGGAVHWPSVVADEQQQRQRQQHHVRPTPHGILRRPRNSPPFPMSTNGNNNSTIYGRRDSSWGYEEMNGSSSRRPTHSNIKAPWILPSTENRSRNHRTASETKRILLTRHYKHENIFKDLGIRVVGGKKLANGDLGAFITKIDSSKAQEMLGELREGDQILEWNGILLSGKTFEEVERVIHASNLGEIELIVRSRRNLYDNGQLDDEDEQEEEAGDRSGQSLANAGGGIMVENGADQFGHRQHSSTRKNIAFAESTKNGASWHSPNEPPPIPAHRPQNNQNNNNNSSEWAPAEIKWSNSAGGGRKTRDQLTPPPAALNNGGGRHLRQRSAGHLQVAIAYDRQSWILSIRLIAAHGLATYGQQMPNPFIKVYLLPERKVSNKRRTKYVPATCNPVWDQLVEYSIPPNQLERHYLEFTVIDYDRQTTDLDSRIIGQLHVGLSDHSSLNGAPRWLALQCPTVSSAPMRNTSPMDTPANYQLPPNKTYYNPAALDLLDGYPAIA